MASQYQEAQREKARRLIKNNDPVFYGAQGGGKFRGISRDFVLVDTDNVKNLYCPIITDVLEYFKNNRIAWWGEDKAEPSGHTLSSQISCINHLFSLRDDKDAVLAILKNFSQNFKDVLKISSDKYSPAYIQFEAVSDKDHLNEKYSSRGARCTSIDALIYAIHNDGSKWLIPIEWKYTEFYNNQDKAMEGCRKNQLKCKGQERQARYTALINASAQLKSSNHKPFYYEPFYQLMRQTLWAERMIRNKNTETLQADHFLHVHVIPSANKDLLEKKYKYSGKFMEPTWKDQLIDPSRYVIINPEKLLDGIDRLKYQGLLEYLRIRYW